MDDGGGNGAGGVATVKEKEKAAPSPRDLAALMRDFTRSAQEWTRTYAQMQAEVMRLNAELREKNALLKSKERLAALGRMAAGVAHEIRNPLGGIQLYANLLQRSLVDRPSEAALVEKILSGVRHMEQVVRQTLTFAGNLTPRLRPCALEPLVRSALDVSGFSEAGGRDIRVAVEIDPELTVRGDPDLLIQMFGNLFVNAREAMPQGGGLSVRASRVAEGVRVEVADTGPGVPEDIRSRLFDPFVTSKADGVGLGLSIVWRIVEAHQGEIRLDPEAAAGARFIATLPAAAGGEAS